MSNTVERVCTTCVLCLREDYGSSNYTTEGTELACLASLNPDMDGKEAAPWRESEMALLAPILDFAKTCPRYRFGAPATLDVDHEDIPSSKSVTAEIVKAGGYTDDDEAASLLAMRLTHAR